MNLTEALNVALPEIPAQAWKGRFPRVHPKLVGREHIENGQPVVSATISGTTWLYSFTPLEWQVIHLFDGKRSYDEIAELATEQTGVQITGEEVREMASNLDRMDFWYKTPFEKNVALKQKLAEERHKHTAKKSKYGDVSHLQFSAWDPDLWFDSLLPKLRWMYSRWFTVLTVLAYFFMAYVFVTRWDEIGYDTLQFYNFTEKGFHDIVEFWVLACGVLFIHEAAHGLTCKYYGGHVHRMGFHLIYLTPAFFTDVTEAWVYATKWQRVITIVSGAWSEMILCAIATPIWWGTPDGTFVHEAAYKLVLITGLGVIFFNWNPLIKLDGYYLITEILGIPELKEESTAFVSGWVKRKIWRLPVEIPFVPRRRRPWYVVYALLSGLYSYSLLWFVAKLAGNIASNWWPDWGFLATIGIAFLIFRSRIRTLVAFMKTLYLDKKDRIQAWFTPQRRVAAAVLLALLAFLPIFRETIDGRFILEPVERAVIHAAVPGTVVEVAVIEGQQVAAGQPLLRLRNLALESQASRAGADLRLANARATQAHLQYTDLGGARFEREQAVRQAAELGDRVSRLSINAPISGVVLTPRVQDRLGQQIEEGTQLVEIGDLATMRARIYLPEFAVRKARTRTTATLLLDSAFTSVHGEVTAIAPVSHEIPDGLIAKTAYKGIAAPIFYVATVELPNDGAMKAGAIGSAKVFVQRRSLAGMLAEPFWEFFWRKVW